MKKLLILMFIFSLFLVSSVFASDFYLHDNGVTIKCENASINDTGVIDGVTYTKRAVGSITTANADTTCTSGITSMFELFRNTFFNSDVGHWDTSSVTNMYALFDSSHFNHDLSYWNTSSVTNMDWMFYYSPFNKDIGNWDTSSVTSMQGMFFQAHNFNQDLSAWCVSLIPSYPALFDDNSDLSIDNRPVWGTCPPYILKVRELFNSSLTGESVRINIEFRYNDFKNVTNYLIFDGENQTKINYTKDTSETESLFYDISSLDSQTTYTYDYCIEYENNGTQTSCYGEQSFTTPILLPYINIINAFDITGTTASLGATVFYGDYENLTLEYYLDGSKISDDDFNQENEYDTSVYYLENLNVLDFTTTYNYSLDITYLDPNQVGGSDSNWVQEYRVNGSVTMITNRHGDQMVEKWTALDDREITTSAKCVELCNRYYADPELNNGTITEGEGTCWYIEKSGYPYDECYIGGDNTFIAEWEGATGSYAQNMNQTVTLPRTITGETYNFTTLDRTPPSINLVSALNITWNSTRLGGSFVYNDYINVSATFVFNGSNEDSIYVTKNDTSGETIYLNITDLESNTTYTYKMCLNYGDGYLLYNCSEEYNFTTLVRSAPSPIIVSFNNVSGTYLDMSGSFSYGEYTTVKATLYLSGEDFGSYSESFTFDYDINPSQYYEIDTITGLTENTTYIYDMYLDYGEELRVTYGEGTITTGFDPIITLSETLVTGDSARLNINIDYNNVENVSYLLYFRDIQLNNWTWANDGLNIYNVTDLEPRTNHTYYVKVNYSTTAITDYGSVTSSHIITSDNQTFMTYYDNAMDDIWDTLLQGSIIAKLLLGFAIVILIIFFGVSIFGTYGMQLKAGGILILFIIGVVIATLMNLFELYILILMIIGIILIFIVKKTMGDSN